ncbi:hypothetical protein [Hymenobacter sediminicola]|uniref:Uncharacterized protein n=1 Tax=Hymenobacter sediminicola TaxID=2761579 RepID=A0A7G7W6R8_9BACT|nr:hypothetical protein [Hymenobacter sediminicola]QNH62061.1 hypothetical protein H4317_18250 [Hymenobacter sediminicola]
MIVYTLLIACLLLALGLAVAAWKRPDPRRRAARVVASILAVAALWLTAYPPHRTSTVPQAEAILLTSGYQPDTLSALLRRLGPATRIWRYQPNTSAAVRSDTPSVARLGILREQQPVLRQLHVLGTGLPPAVMPELGSIRVIPHTPPAFTGFQTAYWNRSVELGQPLLLEGFFTSSARTAVWVRLQSAGATQDSVRLPGGRGAFRLRYTPKTAGRLVATLSAGPTARLLAQEPVPAEVLPTRPLRVLLLAATPSFELKFLKNHLAVQQHAVAWRAGISRGLTQTEFSNHPTTDLNRLTSALLARFDVLIADAAVLASCAPSETQALRSAQRTGGLGLILLAESATLPKAALAPGIRVQMQPGAGIDRPRRLAEVAATAVVPATLQLNDTAQPLFSVAGLVRPVAAAQRLGQGTVVVTTLPETYPWLLQNTPAPYNTYWSRLLTAAARPAEYSSRWTVVTPWPRLGLPVTVQLSATVRPTRAPVVSDATGKPLAQLALLQDTGLPEWNTATYWPAQTGWQQLQRPGQVNQWVYVFGKNHWLGPQQQSWAQMALSAQSVSSKPVLLAVTVAWPVGWFFALFVLAAGFLWLEEKL